MRSHLVCLVAAVVVLHARPSSAQAVSSATVNVQAQFSARTSLKVSSDLLQFTVAESGGAATAAVEFSAGARTPASNDVVLTVEPLRAIEGPGGAADTETALSVGGEGAGLQAAQIAASHSTIVGRWQGSGVRQGRLVFTLRAASSGTYTVPVRFVLSAP